MSKRSNKDLAKELGAISKESEKNSSLVVDKLDAVIDKLDKVSSEFSQTQDSIDKIKSMVFDIISSMQYQDIHRQKIERVINTMRGIANMMNSTLDSVEEDINIAPSAKHIDGDNSDEVLNSDDIEALIAQMNDQK
jgi:methyl-accepting chemotaxis protein